MNTLLVFFSTTESSVTMLKRILEMKDISVPFVVTRKGKPAGRKLITEPSAVAKFCKEKNISCIEVEKIKEILEQLKQFSSDLFFVVDFGKILPQEILDIPPKGTVNFHPSLLPKYRGPSPITASILNGDTETGFSYMILDAEMDHGPILYQEKIPISPDDTAGTLEKKLFKKGAEKLEYVLTEYLAGALKPIEQDHSRATVTKLIKKEDAHIDFSRDSSEIIERKIRAYNPEPFAFFFHKGKRIQILESQIQQCSDVAMQQFIKTKDGIVASCAQNTCLLLKLIKPEGKPARASREFEQYF